MIHVHAPTALFNFSPINDPFSSPKIPRRQKHCMANETISQAGDIAKNRLPPAKRRTLQCTHMDMIAVFGDKDCQLCGQASSLGFIYVCRQDTLEAAQKLPAEEDVELSSFSDIASLAGKALMAESLGMSISVVKQIRGGVYTNKQIEKLFSQRRHVISTIRSALDSSSEKTETTEGRDITGSSVQRPVTVKSDRCELQVCHACKPFLLDRTYADPATVVEEGFKHWTAAAVDSLPVRAPHILMGLVLPGEHPQKQVERRIAPPTSTTPVSVSESDYSGSSANSMSPYESSFNESHITASPSRRYDMTDTTNTWLSETPEKTAATPGTSDSMSEASSFSPLTPLRPVEDTFETSIEKKVGTFAKSASFCGPFRPARNILRNKTSWPGPQNTHMTGSIAVTEESVETGVPDIVTSTIDGLKL